MRVQRVRQRFQHPQRSLFYDDSEIPGIWKRMLLRIRYGPVVVRSMAQFHTFQEEYYRTHASSALISMIAAAEAESYWCLNHEFAVTGNTWGRVAHLWKTGVLPHILLLEETEKTAKEPIHNAR